MDATSQLIDDSTPAIIDDEQLEAVAAVIADSFGLGEEFETTSSWMVDGGDYVFAVPFEGAQTGTLLFAVNLDISERLLADRDRLTSELQNALRTLGDPELRVGEVTQTTERPARCVEIKDGGRACALVGFFVDGGDEGPVTATPFNELERSDRMRGQSAWSVSEHDLRLLDMLGDVEVVVKAELGRTTMPLTSVLGLLPGVVFELDRVVGDPIDIVVDDSVVGHGDVVTVDEHYGVRLVGLGVQVFDDDAQ